MHAKLELLSLTSLLILVAPGCAREYEADSFGDDECSIGDDCEDGQGQDGGQEGGDSGFDSRGTGEIDIPEGEDEDGDIRRPDPSLPPGPGPGPSPEEPGCEGVDEREPSGCTYTQGYWENHGNWPATAQVDFCGFSGLELLMQPVEGNAWMNLAHQFIAAELNVANGASTTCNLDVAMYKAQLLLEKCELVDAADISAALQLAGMLDDYNNGEIGPGHCG